MSETAMLFVHDEGQKAIMDVAAQCFLERGFHATSIDDVARRLGSTKGRVYHFFASKADLLFAVAEHGMDVNFKAIEPYLDADMPAIKKLYEMAIAHTLAMINYRPYQNAVWQGVEIYMRGATTPEQRERLSTLVDTRDRYSTLFRSVLEQARDDGALSYRDGSIARQLMFMTLNSPVFWYKPREGETDADRLSIARQCVDFALSGLDARHAAV
ncbi:TetR/AcrR family transcriptional regulator [Rhizobium sp. L1K21]|uniref:TetR/AcrR family transcriptional regulator n=1 Tax=Rhizobium sp. L1K21 TaxID=2954933 RepID=UPI0020934969|nr:TetR/AcrR family transcriptional regulator [Rhizobium sp. L1K21]MCO6188311.1 TetR/AcrR family transcriptional regulator [Rhizobium sp. L1K21]